ncbi:MAG: FAD-dependent thymidylate synthase, partial [Christensenellales bacterium]
CVSTKSFDEIESENISKSLKRAETVKVSGHHSVFDHEYLTFEIQNLSKAFAMVLNNEKAYNTTEKSMRYTVNYNNMTNEEKELYTKWQNIFEEVIADKYQKKYPNFFTDEKIKKLAQENARYLLSVYAPTSMIYTASVRQLNYIYKFLAKEIEKENSNIFYEQLKSSFADFNAEIERFGILDKNLMDDNKNRKLSLYNDYNATNYYGDVYSTNYMASFAYLAQAQRHRTLNYSFNLPMYYCYYLPTILENRKDKTYANEWINDCRLAQTFTTDDISQNLIQANLLRITEQGTLDNFILKMKERKCTFAQLEINQKTNEILNDYVTELEKQNHARADELKAYQKGARCTFPDYKCTNRCGFVEGVNETREI